MEMMTGYKGIGGQWESLPANRRRLERPSRLGGTITKDIQTNSQTMKRREKRICSGLLEIFLIFYQWAGWEQLPTRPLDI